MCPTSDVIERKKMCLILLDKPISNELWVAIRTHSYPKRHFPSKLCLVCSTFCFNVRWRQIKKLVGININEIQIWTTWNVSRQKRKIKAITCPVDIKTWKTSKTWNLLNNFEIKTWKTSKRWILPKIVSKRCFSGLMRVRLKKFKISVRFE